MAAVGVWENITPPGIPIPPPKNSSGAWTFYGSKQPLLNPQDTATVYLGVDKHGVFRSPDCGATWTKVNTGRNGATLDTGAQWSMAIDPINPQIIYANNGYGSELGVWKTTNGGVDWDQTMPTNGNVGQIAQYDFASIISMDPMDHTHLVVSFHGTCSGAYAPGCLAETKDSGATWGLIKVPSGGSEAAGIVVLTTKTWVYGVPSVGLWVTTDGGANWNQAANDGGYTVYRASTGTYYLAGEGMSPIHTSSDGVTWMPGVQNGYTVWGDGITLFASARYCTTDCYSTSPETDGKTWTTLKTPVTGQGAVNMIYDPDHHILYSSNETAGFWRVVTH